MSRLTGAPTATLTASAAIFCGVAGGVCLKIIVDTPSAQILVQRSAFATLAMLGYLLLKSPARLIRPIGKVALWRALLDALAAFTFALAVFELPLSLLTALHLSLPIVSSLLAIPLLGEKINARQAAALGVGFIGVLFILRPGLEASLPGVLLALFSTFCYAARDIVTRRLPGDTDTLRSALIGIVLVGLAAMLVPSDRAFIVPPVPELLWAVLAAAFFIGANMLIVHALRHTSIARVAPLRYASILWAILFDYVLWHITADIFTVIGVAIIICGGLTLARNRE